MKLDAWRQVGLRHQTLHNERNNLWHDEKLIQDYSELSQKLCIFSKDHLDVSSTRRLTKNLHKEYKQNNFVKNKNTLRKNHGFLIFIHFNYLETNLMHKKSSTIFRELELKYAW